jgi:hypothetical protein
MLYFLLYIIIIIIIKPSMLPSALSRFNFGLVGLLAGDPVLLYRVGMCLLNATRPY